jgi:hypothetical protein
LNKSVIHIFLLLVSCNLLVSCAELGIQMPRSGNPSAGGGNQGNGRGNAEASVTITAGDARRIARDLGLTGYRSLPPGIARNLARGKALPPGIAKQYPPQNMLSRLPVIAGHEWQITGRDLVLIAIGTLIVVEILDDVFS